MHELHKFLAYGGIEMLEATKFYRDKGFVWFYMSKDPTHRDGPSKFNAHGDTTDAMFQGVSHEEYGNLSFNEKAYFFSGDMPLQVVLNSNPFLTPRRLSLYGHISPSMGPAPVAVVKNGGMAQKAGEPTLQKVAPELVGKFRTVVAKMDSAAKEGLWEPELTQTAKEVLRAIE